MNCFGFGFFFQSFENRSKRGGLRLDFTDHFVTFVKTELACNRPFPSSSQPPFQSEAKCKVFVMKISFQSY